MEEEKSSVGEAEPETFVGDETVNDDVEHQLTDDNDDLDEDDEEIDDDEDEDYDDDRFQSTESPRPFDRFEFASQEDDNVSVSDDIDPLYTDTTEQLPTANATNDQWSDGDHVCSSKLNQARRFICINYPGIVENKERAIATLGGRDLIAEALSRTSRMELSFRPEDPFSKPVLSSETKTSHFVLKVKRRRMASGSRTCASQDGFEYKIEVVGVIDRTIDFKTPFDFQFLPVEREKDGRYKELLSSIVPGLHEDRKSFLSRPAPLFLPPFVFNRKESRSVYDFADDVAPAEKEKAEAWSKRARRDIGTIQMCFSDKTVPSEPHSVAMKIIKRFWKSESNDNMFAALKKIFDEHPIWTRARIQGVLPKLTERHLKILLPVVAFYIATGPWTKTWCRLGYDPRKHPEAKIYQAVDFRVRTSLWKSKFEYKRGSDYRLMTQLRQISKNDDTTLPVDKSDPAYTEAPQEGIPGKERVDLRYMFFPDKIPPYRQINYQIRDIFEEEVQRKAHENDGKETTCTKRDGWCVPDFTDITRDILNRHVVRLLKQQHGT